MSWFRVKTKTKPGNAPAPTVPEPDRPIAEGQPDAPPADQTATGSASVSQFLAELSAMGPRVGTERGRLVFAMDATMSRQPTWDMALTLQADMFDVVADVGGLDVQLIYFRGHGECRASKWVSDPKTLAGLMTRVTVAGGLTQIRKVLSNTLKETQSKKVHALVYVGDAMEEEVDDLCGRAGELALHGVPVFLFQEGHNAQAARAFREIARLTKGAHCQFGPGSAAELRALLSAVAVYAAGGRAALEDFSRKRGERGAQLLLEQMTDRRS
ncbi:MAG: VWA domain-containing protein [Pseudomonadota bacterium]